MHAFGSFNPNFYGVSQGLLSPEMMEVMQSYSEAKDVAEWHDAQSDHDLARLGAVSAIDHEIRHFHDFLLSPWAMQTMIFRIQATINGQSAVSSLTQAPGEIVPVPLIRWARWDDKRRQKWLATDGVQAGIRSLSELVEVPQVDFDTPMGQVARAMEAHEVQTHFPMFTEACIRSYWSMERYRDPVQTPANISVSATGLFEATAHIVQGIAIYMGQGAPAFRSFMQELGKSRSDHLLPLQFVMRFLNEQGIEPEGRRLLQLFTWTLLTPPGLAMEVAHPANRFYAVLLMLASDAKAMMSDPGASAATVWDALDEKTNLTPWRDILGAALQHIDARVKLIEQTFGGDHPAENFLALVRQWQLDVIRMCNSVIEDPDAYCDGERYLNAWTPHFPAPLVLTHYGGGAYNGPIERDPDRTILLSMPNDKNLTLGLIQRLFDQTPKELLGRTGEAYTMQKVIDYVFYEEATHRVLDGYFRHVAEQISGKRFVNVF